MAKSTKRIEIKCVYGKLLVRDSGNDQIRIDERGETIR